MIKPKTNNSKNERKSYKNENVTNNVRNEDKRKANSRKIKRRSGPNLSHGLVHCLIKMCALYKIIVR